MYCTCVVQSGTVWHIPLDVIPCSKHSYQGDDGGLDGAGVLGADTLVSGGGEEPYITR